ncbi:MAG: hypothetical protein HOV94_03235, partial [Saccharothrix sp.]|nr:hypothetical protein [Saccharothrix sp.]
AATGWHDRERHLAAALETAAAMHNETALTEPVDPTTRPFHDRPYRVLHAERFAAALIAGVHDPVLRDLPLTGALDQFVDNTDVHQDRALTRLLVRAALGAARPSPGRGANPR